MTMLDPRELSRHVEVHGYALQDGILSNLEADELIESIENEQAGQGVHRNGKIFAIRNLLDSPTIRTLAGSEQILAFARAILGGQSISGPGHPFRQNTGSKLEGAVASGRHHRGADESRGRGIWPLVNESWHPPRAAPRISA